MKPLPVTHMLAGATTPERPPTPPFPLSASAAFDLAAWYVQYGLDRIDADERCQHPAVRAHGTAAKTQLNATNKAIQL